VSPLKAKLDVKSITAWVRVAKSQAYILTKDIRKHVTWIRDKHIEILKEEGKTVREIAAEVGCGIATVSRHDGVPNTTMSQMKQED